MLLPKFAAHISSFKLSHFANRSHQHFQHLRNSFNNSNLGSTVSQNAHPVGNSAGAGLGSASGSSTAGGAGGAKWSAGSRTGWNQQSHSRLITHANSTAQDGLNSRPNDDDELDDMPQSLGTIALYHRRNMTISSEWRNDQFKLSSPVSHSPSIQLRYKSAFVQAANAEPSNTQQSPIAHLPRSRSRRQSSPGQPPVGLALDSNDSSSTHARRFSTGNSSRLASELVDDHVAPSHRRHSTSASGPASELGVPDGVQLMTSRSHQLGLPATTKWLNGSSVPRPISPPTEVDWLAKSATILQSPQDSSYSIFYQLRKLLDSYVSSTASPSTAVVDLIFWGLVVHKPGFEPIDNLLNCHQFLLANTPFKPSANTYSILITALCKRDVSNAIELDHRRNRLDALSMNQQLNQRLPELFLAPNPATDDLKTINWLSAEPNLDYAVRLFRSLDSQLRAQLQPAVFDEMIRSCSILDRSPAGRPTLTIEARLDIAMQAFRALEEREACTAQSYMGLITLLGNSRDMSRAKALFDSYKQARADAQSGELGRVGLYHEHYLQAPTSATTAEIAPRPSIPADGKSDAGVLLSLMNAHLTNGDSVSAVTLLEESLPPLAAGPAGFESNANHILAVILGFIRLGDYASASTWIKRLFNGDHASYELNQPEKRRTFMDKIVRLACEPGRGTEALGVAYDAAMISLDQIDEQFDIRAMSALLARLRHVLNSLLVYALDHSAALGPAAGHSDDIAANVMNIKDALEKACSIVCHLISKRAALLEADRDKFGPILDNQTYGTIENLLKRVTQACQALRSRWLVESGDSTELAGLATVSERQLVRLIEHHSLLPDEHLLRDASAELRHQSSYLTGLLTGYESALRVPAGANSEELRRDQFAFAVKITTPVVANNLSLVLAMKVYELYSACKDGEEFLRSVDDWLMLLTVGAMLEVQVRGGKTIPSVPGSGPQSVLKPLMDRFDRALALAHPTASLGEPSGKIDVQFLIRVIDRYCVTLPPGGRVKALLRRQRNEEVEVVEKAEARLEYCIGEGAKYLSNRFEMLGEQLNVAGEWTGSGAGQSPTAVSQDAGSTLVSPNLSSRTAASQVPMRIEVPKLEEASQPIVPVPHPPFKTFDHQLSQVALSMFCTKDLVELEKLYEAVHQAAVRGEYLSAEAAAGLIETFGRQRQLGRLREMYVYGHVALAAVSGETPGAQAARAASWQRVEDKMIIGLAYCGRLDEVGVHKNRLHASGAAPSADAYAAMVQHAHETTDDASVALAYFEEALAHRVRPNTFLCNTIISKLSKARRGSEALQVFEYMKQHHIPRNSVTFGAIINACCKTGNWTGAEKLFKEMRESKEYKARVAPFNTMMQMYVQGVKIPNREKAVEYYRLMGEQNLRPSDHTYNLLMQAYGMIEPYDWAAVERVFGAACRDTNVVINGAHWATLLTVKGKIDRDVEGAQAVFERIGREAQRPGSPRLPDAVCYEALFNVFAEKGKAELAEQYVERMTKTGVHMTAYVVNSLVRMYARAGDMERARELFERLEDPPPGQAGAFNHPISAGGHGNGLQRVTGRPGDPVYREPSCFETMIWAEVKFGELNRAEELLKRMQLRAYPTPILMRARKILDEVVDGEEGEKLN